MRRNQDSLIFDSLQLEGGLFVPAILEKAARGDHEGQKPADYQLPKGLSLLDEQGRAFRIASALWKNFSAVRERTDIDTAKATTGFVIELLRDTLGYSDIQQLPEPIVLNERHYPVTCVARGCVPIIVAPHNLEVDTPDPRFAVIGSGTRRKSAFQLAQQFLNASDAHTWAIATNGLKIRLLRDADTLTRPSYLEIDLELILKDNRYADFAAVWRLLHATRASGDHQPCIWESWKLDGQAQGNRVRSAMRVGVTEALQTLGNAFLTHPKNDALRKRLHNRDLSEDAYFQQLLRLVYRFLFLFTIEERELLHIENNSPAGRSARRAYASGYGMRRLRRRALRRSGFDHYSDLWEGVRIVFRGLAEGQPALALPALGGLFAEDQCPDLDSAVIDNQALLTVMRHLRWSSATGHLAAVDYRNMGPEELGSVYESLLELVPTVDLQIPAFGFVGITDDGSSDGNARKTSGSYYTDDTLVQQLLDSALDPVIEARLAAHPNNPTAALLGISVIDPACGSGHFLLGAARRLAERLAELRAADGAVQKADYYHALREVISHCIYGVDRNPMALELARTALWLEGYEPGQPLSFLGHHLVCGDALLGLTDFKQLEAGIPKDAFKELSGDDKATCQSLARENTTALKSLNARLKDKTIQLFDDAAFEDIFHKLERIEAMPEETTRQVAAKQRAYTRFLEEANNGALAHAADLCVAAFLTPKTVESSETCPTTQTLLDLLFPQKGTEPPRNKTSAATACCREATVLHWPLAFAQIFARGGFDCVLGNPPWERIKLQEKEFFAARHGEIATAQNKVARDRMIQALRNGNEADQSLYSEFIRARRLSEAMSAFAHVNDKDGGRFPLTGVGDVNTYALFAETIQNITAPKGRAGFIVPTGIATDDSTKDFFASLPAKNRLVSLFDFENREKIFAAVDSRMKFCLVTLGPSESAQFAFFLLNTEQLEDSRRNFTLSAEDFALINPNTLTCPVFRSAADAELTKKIYRHVPVLIKESRDGEPENNPWGITFSTMFHMSGDSGYFLDQPQEGALPLYEAKMMHQFDHRWATYFWDADKNAYDSRDVPVSQKKDPNYAVQPRYWLPKREVIARIAKAPKAVIQSWLQGDEDALLKAVAIWIEAPQEEDILSGFSHTTARQRVVEQAGPAFERLPQKESAWREEKLLAEARNFEPLSDADLKQIRSAESLDAAVSNIVDERSPRWLMGWRDICRTTDERTVIASVVPRVGLGNTMPIFLSPTSPRLLAATLGNWNSLCLDFIARQKIGGTHLTYFYLKQLPILPPESYTQADLDYIVPRVLELTYTSHDLADWARDLGYTGVPFGFDPERRARLRAELDAYYALLYGLTKEELTYILDPAETHGDDYPTETFRGLKSKDLKAYGHYRTRDLVLEAWGGLERKDEVAPIRTSIPSNPRKVAGAKELWTEFIYAFCCQFAEDATLPQLEEAWNRLARRDLYKTQFEEVLAQDYPAWEASFTQRLPNKGFFEHFTTLDQNKWLSVDRQDWRISIPPGSAIENFGDNEWILFDVSIVKAMLDRMPSAERGEFEESGFIEKFQHYLASA